MKGTVYPPERTFFTDPATGARVYQMTCHPSINHLSYFLQSSFTPDSKRLIFTSYRTGTAQLFEAVPYLADAGWHQTAKLLTNAATEIGRLQVDSRGQRDRGAWPDRPLAKPIFSPIHALIFGCSYCSAVRRRQA